MQLQIKSLFPEFNKLQKKYGDKNLAAIYGAGCLVKPKYCFVFMNPTARNVASDPNWKGIRAQWLGTKNVWKIFYNLKLIDKFTYDKTRSLKPFEWSSSFSYNLYKKLNQKRVYITNLAKCTQLDARPLPNSLFKQFLPLLFEELSIIKPKNIISFGNQVSSILLGQNIKVSDYLKGYEKLTVRDVFYKVYPTYYPVGQGMRNMYKAIKRIKTLV